MGCPINSAAFPFVFAFCGLQAVHWRTRTIKVSQTTEERKIHTYYLEAASFLFLIFHSVCRGPDRCCSARGHIIASAATSLVSLVKSIHKSCMLWSVHHLQLLPSLTSTKFRRLRLTPLLRAFPIAWGGPIAWVPPACLIGRGATPPARQRWQRLRETTAIQCAASCSRSLPPLSSRLSRYRGGDRGPANNYPENTMHKKYTNTRVTQLQLVHLVLLCHWLCAPAS